MPESLAFNIAVYARSDVGMVRPGNEDNFLVLNLLTADTWTPGTSGDRHHENLTTFIQSGQGTVIAVSDGMGGAVAGEVASRIAVESIRDRMLELQSSSVYAKFPFHERLRLAIELANRQIFDTSAQNPRYQGMGATVTALGLFGASAFFGQVGDSRAYLIRGGRIQQVTRDQSLVGHLVQAGQITPEEAEKHTYKNVILQALGAAPQVNVEIDRLALRDLDIIVLCSDGLSNKVRADEIMQLVDEAPSLKEACDALVLLANRRGGDDNVTVVVSQITGAQLPPQEFYPQSGTIPLSSGTAPLKGAWQDSSIPSSPPPERWGAQTVPRPVDLPTDVPRHHLDDEEDTLRPADSESNSTNQRVTKGLKSE